MLDLGPGASNPCEEFIDINKAVAGYMLGNVIISGLATLATGTSPIG